MANFADLMKNPAELGRVTRAFNDAIVNSFAVDKSRVTQNETRRRFGILEKWFRALRTEKRWTLERVLDSLPRALRCELEHQTFEPDSRTLWIPTDGAIG